MRKISVVIVCYNGRDYLPDCLNSLKKQTVSPFQIIIVDNASKDQSILYIKKEFPNIILIENKENKGFAEANNQGIRKAMESNPDYIFLLNQDTVVDEKCLEKLVEADKHYKNQKIFCFQPLILLWSQKELIQTSGDRIHFLGFGYSGNYKMPISQFPQYSINQLPEITYASGAAMFIRVKSLNDIGLFDQDLFLYHEDLDLNLRARILGYSILLAPQAKIWHKYTSEVSLNKWYWSERGRQIVLLKFYKIPTLVLLFPLYLIMEIGTFGYSLLTNKLLVKIKADISALYQIPKTLKKRKIIQKRRKLSDRELIKFFDGKFKFSLFFNPVIKYFVNPLFNFAWYILRRLVFW